MIKHENTQPGRIEVVLTNGDQPNLPLRQMPISNGTNLREALTVARDRLKVEFTAIEELLAETPRELLDILLDLARVTLNLETAQDTMTPAEWELVVNELRDRKKIGSVADLARCQAVPTQVEQCKICGASTNSLVSWEDLHHYLVPEQPTLHVITNANKAQFLECEKMWEDGTEKNLDDWLHEAGYVALVCGE